MASLKIRYLIVILLLTVTAFIVNGLQYDSSQDEETGLTDLQTIPMQIGKWKGKDFPLEAMVYEILETKAIIHRSYTRSDGCSIFLSIVHYSDTKVDFHAPESCFGGEGLNVEKITKKITLFAGDQKKTFNIAEIITTSESGQSLIYYLYRSGNFLGSNYIKMRLSIAANNLFKNDAKGSLVRISKTFIPGDKAAAELILNDFLEDFFPHIQKSL